MHPEEEMAINKGKIVVYIDSDLKDIVPRFLEIRQENINNILKALESEDYEPILRIGHSMKGSGTGYGFDYITEIGHSIEDAAKMKNLEAIRECVKKLSTYLENIEIVYK
jgi:HPt (histidine-containing phosphotransfer) domain-containing protein